MATVATSFTAVGEGNKLFVRKGTTFTYAVSGTFVGTVRLERSLDGGSTWERLAITASDAASGQFESNIPVQPNDAHYRFFCSAFTSGTIVTSLVNVAKTLLEFKDDNGNTLFKVTESGVTVAEGLEIGEDNARWRVAVNHPAILAITDHEAGDFIWCANAIWQYDPESEAEVAADTGGSYVLRPTDIAAEDPGRWLRRPLSFPDASVGVAQFSAASGVVRDQGRKYINVLRLASDVADGETVTIGGDVYEFDDDDDFTEGNIQVDVSGGLTPTAASEALVDAIASQQGVEVITAVAISVNEILISPTSGVGSALACTQTMGGANNAWGSATMYGGVAAATKNYASAFRVPTAAEVTLGNMHFAFQFTPTVAHVEVRVTATGAIKLFAGAVTLGAGRVTVTNDTNPDFAETDTVYVVATA